jgi:hypothetical protein
VIDEYPDAPAGWREPKIVQIAGQDGVERPYLISKFPALLGRELVSKYPVANMPKIGDYGVSEEVMLKLMTRVAALRPDKKVWLPLISKELYDNHVLDWEAGAKIEGAAWEHNCSFFENGKLSIFCGDIARNLQRWITSTLTDLLVQSLSQAKQPSANSPNGTP